MATGHLRECGSLFDKRDNLHKLDLLRFRLDDSFFPYLSNTPDKCSGAAPKLTQTAHYRSLFLQPESPWAVRPLYMLVCLQSVGPRLIVRVADQ